MVETNVIPALLGDYVLSRVLVPFLALPILAPIRRTVFPDIIGAVGGGLLGMTALLGLLGALSAEQRMAIPASPLCPMAIIPCPGDGVSDLAVVLMSCVAIPHSFGWSPARAVACPSAPPKCPGFPIPIPVAMFVGNFAT